MAFYQVKKNKCWIWKAYCRTTGQLVDWECGDRSGETLAKLLGRLKRLNVTVFFTDNWKVYSELIPQEMLVQTKAETHGIERNNSRQRHWFGRFRRKTCIVSRSIKMVDLTMSLFARFHVNGAFDTLVRMFGWIIIFTALSRKELRNITDAVLAAMLKELIENGLIDRKQYNVIPPKVEYSLTEKGQSVLPILQNICYWSRQQTKDTLDKKLPSCKNCEQLLI